jgi:hypothetical protein
MERIRKGELERIGVGGDLNSGKSVSATMEGSKPDSFLLFFYTSSVF